MPRRSPTPAPAPLNGPPGACIPTTPPTARDVPDGAAAPVADNNAKLFKQGATSAFKANTVKIAKSYDTPGYIGANAQNESQQAITALGKQRVRRRLRRQ
jgi:hypothetical protein